MGEGNPAAIRSGAFWFYRKLGFLPDHPAVERIARAEEARKAARPGHRSDRRTLRKLSHTQAHLDLSGGRCRPFPFGALGVALSRWIAERARRRPRARGAALFRARRTPLGPRPRRPRAAGARADVRDDRRPRALERGRAFRPRAHRAREGRAVRGARGAALRAPPPARALAARARRGCADRAGAADRTAPPARTWVIRARSIGPTGGAAATRRDVGGQGVGEGGGGRTALRSAEAHAVDRRQVVRDGRPALAAVLADVEVAGRACRRPGARRAVAVEGVAVDRRRRRSPAAAPRGAASSSCPPSSVRATNSPPSMVMRCMSDLPGTTQAVAPSLGVRRDREAEVHARVGRADLAPGRRAVAAVEHAAVVLLPDVVGLARGTAR